MQIERALLRRSSEQIETEKLGVDDVARLQSAAADVFVRDHGQRDFAASRIRMTAIRSPSLNS